MTTDNLYDSSFKPGLRPTLNIPNPNDDARIYVKIYSARTGDVIVKTSNSKIDENLGLIQSLKINAEIGKLNTLHLECILEKAEVEFLLKETEVKVLLPRFYKLRFWMQWFFGGISERLFGKNPIENCYRNKKKL